MKQLVLKPNNFPCTLRECPPGPFLFNDVPCFKSEYRHNNGRIDAYNQAGEFFCANGEADVNAVIVQPLEWFWEEM